MRPTTLLLIGLSAVAVLAALLVLPRGEERGPDPSLETLLRERAKGDPGHASRFFAALSAVLRRHGVGPRYFDFAEEGHAVAVEGRNRHVVVVLRGWEHAIPGWDKLDLTLLGEDGRPLDRLACDINNRKTLGMGSTASYYAEVPEAVQGDGADLVIRYALVGGNWSHDITHRGKTYRYGWNEEGPGSIPPAVWSSKGLCRLAVRGGKFVVLFPELEGRRAVP